MTESTASHEIVRRLIERQSASPDGSYAAVQGACDDVCRAFARWVGSSGCRALFTRAIGTAARAHPVLQEMRVHDEDERLDGVQEAAQSFGAGATASALEAMLIEVIELMGRFIGDDMVANLVGDSSGAGEQPDGRV
jgi:hypothetical protein